jgi:hypothetical protein
MPPHLDEIQRIRTFTATHCEELQKELKRKAKKSSRTSRDGFGSRNRMV